MSQVTTWKSHGVLSTLFLGLLIPAFWWNPSANSQVWFVGFCFVMGFPLTFLRQGELGFLPAWGAVVGLLLWHRLMTSSDLSWSTWSSWAAGWFGDAGQYCVQTLFVPIGATFLGCVAARSVWQLKECVWPTVACDSPCDASWTQILGSAAFFLVANLALVIGATFASHWLRAHAIYPFQNGLWNVLVPFIPAPSSLHEMLVTPAGVSLFLASAILLTLLSIKWAKHAGRPQIVASVGLLSFVTLGFPALWVIGDMFINYYIHDVASGFWSKS